jgi:hypothetical protein
MIVTFSGTSAQYFWLYVPKLCAVAFIMAMTLNAALHITPNKCLLDYFFVKVVRPGLSYPGHEHKISFSMQSQRPVSQIVYVN